MFTQVTDTEHKKTLTMLPNQLFRDKGHYAHVMAEDGIYCVFSNERFSQ